MKLNEKKTELISIGGHHKDLNKTVSKNALNIELRINDTSIKNYKKVKYLGVVISSNFKFIDHVKHVLHKVNIAKSLLEKAFRDKFLKTEVKLLLYKQQIRPIIIYASTIWMQISSHQMELIRKIERSILRKATGIYKSRLTKKFVNSKILYETAKTNRIDRKMIENNLKFIEKIENHENRSISEMVDFSEDYFENNKYKPISIYRHLNRNNQLYVNDRLLIFNMGTRNPQRQLYVTNQNEF